MESEVCAIIPKKKLRGVLSGSEKRENAALAADRIIYENVFGRQGTLWAVVANKYRLAEEEYDRIFRMNVALGSIHVKWHPLRDADGKAYERYLKHLHEIADTYISKRKRAQAAYRKRKKRAVERKVGGGAAVDSGGLFAVDSAHGF